MAPESKPVLYSYWRSSCSWRVRIALNLKKVEYDYKVVDLLSQDALNDKEFVKANPAKRVPVLVVDGKAIGESLAIIEYLEEAYPDVNPLLPKDPILRAQTRAIALQVVATIQPLQNLRAMAYLNKQEAGKGKTFAVHFMNQGLMELENMVSRTAGKYCVGDTVTIPDLTIPGQMYNAQRFGVDLSQFPTLTRINEALSKIDEFQKASPDFQPDVNLNA